jgi:hypothetical protein
MLLELPEVGGPPEDFSGGEREMFGEVEDSLSGDDLQRNIADSGLDLGGKALAEPAKDDGELFTGDSELVLEPEEDDILLGDED